jgi:rod shape-determining protein MreC
MQAVSAWTLEGYGFILEKISVIKRMNAISHENDWLRQKNAELMLENSRLQEALQENQRLRQMLEFKSTSQLDLVPARVIGKGSSGFIHSIILAVGEADSIQKNMAVVTAQGLVGKIFNVSEDHATAQLLLDRNFRASAMIQRSRVSGIVKWHAGNQVMLAEVPKRSDVQVGDVVITSGLSSIFPAGLEIGEVTDCRDDQQNMFMNILVHPAVDFAKLEEVFVIKRLPSQSPPS